jgi:1-acyl-sn-glycerol-3-phosphate acyltransferase
MTDARRERWIRALVPIARGLYRLLGGFRAEGVEHVPPSGPVIVASNHLSWADPPAVRVAMPRACRFMANDFLFRIPLLGAFIRFCGAFPVRRGVMDRDAIRSAEACLRRGEAVCVFPEGGTTITGRLVPFERGVALLAVRTNAPILPAGIAGSDRVLPRRITLPRWARGGVRIRFGPAIRPDEIDPSMPRRERLDRLTERLYDAVAALLEPEYAPPPDQPRLATEWHRQEEQPASHVEW